MACFYSIKKPDYLTNGHVLGKLMTIISFFVELILKEIAKLAEINRLVKQAWQVAKQI